MYSPSAIIPSGRDTRPHSSMSFLPHHQTALDVCDLFYGCSPPAWNTIDRFYDASATYENPFITATSKDTIADIHTLAQHLSQGDVPKPAAVLCAIFRLSRRNLWTEPWFHGWQMWNEITDVFESESFGESASSDTALHVAAVHLQCDTIQTLNILHRRRAQTYHRRTHAQYPDFPWPTPVHLPRRRCSQFGHIHRSPARSAGPVFGNPTARYSVFPTPQPCTEPLTAFTVPPEAADHYPTRVQ